MRTTNMIALATLAVAVGHVARGQETLYGKQPPHGSAFVRFVSTLPEGVVVRSEGRGEVPLGTTSADRVAPYGVIENAASHKLAISIGPTHFSYQPQPDSYATLVLAKDGNGAITMTPILDKAEFNQTRARIAFYNLVPACQAATLALDPGGQTVFADVTFGSTKSRAVNPVQASVKAACPSGVTSTLSLGGMEIGSSYSIWFAEPGAEPALLLTKDASTRYDPND